MNLRGRGNFPSRSAALRRVLGGLALLALPNVADPVRAQDRPNILLITAEDMSPDLGSYGDPYAVTPNLDRLAQTGVRYRLAFATAPVCSPARSTLMLGVHATSTGTLLLRSDLPIPDLMRGYPTYLRQAGYYTTNNGKTDYNTSAEDRLIAESWSENGTKAHWRGRAPGQPFFAVFNLAHTHQSRTTFLDRDFPELASGIGSHDPTRAPVPPYYPNTPTVRKTLARYYDAMTAMDARAGEILRELEADGLADNTIVVFFSDHGAGLPRGKRTLYDSGLRVPLIVRFPERYRHLAPAAPGGEVSRLVSFVDFGPTFLALAGVTPPAHMQGTPFLGRRAAGPRTHVFGARDAVNEALDVSRSVRTERYLYVRNYYPHVSWNAPERYSDQAAIRREIAQMAREGKLNQAQMTYAGPGKPGEELFDIHRDPYQLHNLAGSAEHAVLLDEMRARLRAWELRTRDIGFMPHGELLRRTRSGQTPWEIAQDDERYPLERILDAAGLVGRTDAIAEQVRLLWDSDPVVRYWAAVGLHAAGAAARPARPELISALRDPSPEVRIESAAALVAMGETPEAIAVLTEALERDDVAAALSAARTLQLLGDRALPARPAMERLRTNFDPEGRGIDAYTNWALTDALAAMETSPATPHEPLDRR